MKDSILLFLCAFVCAGLAQADIPHMFSYQGKVTDSSGTPVADGSYTMRFRIYDDPTAGTLEWDSGDQSVQVSGSVFDALLGESPQPSLDLPFDEDYWLLVTVDGDDQAPRQRLGSVGYSFMASGLVAGTEVSGEVTSGTNAALKSVNTATTGTTYGIYCGNASTSGYGVFSEAVFGGRFISDWPDGYGLSAVSSATTGYTYGVLGSSYSPSGTGVFGAAYATTGIIYGVYGYSASVDGRGVSGKSSATDGPAYGVYGESASTAGHGVYGEATAATGVTYGGKFECSSTGGYGVFSIASAATGITYGVYGRSNSTAGRGIYGLASATAGYSYGVRGDSNSLSGSGIYGVASVTTGYGVYSSGNFGASGTKSCVVRTSRGPTLLYCQESPENWFEDFGEGRLINGRAHIELDPLFLETVTIDDSNPMKVFVEHRGPCKGTYVETNTTGFDVVEQENGSSNVGFCYRVVAKRKGFESKRLDYCKAAETDTYLYPELRENLPRENKEARLRIE